MKVLKIHLAEIAAALLFIVLALVFCQDHRGIKDRAHNSPYNEGWMILIGQEAREYEQLPKKVEPPGGEQEIVLTKQLPEELSFINSIGFYTSHQLVEVFVDKEKIYECKVPEGSKSKTPGNCWNFVQLLGDYSGKVLEVHIRNCYQRGQVKVPRFVYGQQAGIMMDLVKSKFFSLMISFIVFAMGALLVTGWCIFGQKLRFHKGVPWLGLFAIHFAVWSVFETQVPMLMFGRALLCSQIDIIALKMMPFPILYFMQVVYSEQNNRVLEALAVVSEAEVGLSLLGQFLGWFDLRQTLWFTHIIGVFVAMEAIVLGVQFTIQKRKNKTKVERKVWMNAVCVGIVGVCIILDAINFYYGFHDDAVFFTRIGCLVYVFVLTKQFLDESVKLIQVGKEAEALREEAELDGLTLLKNRRSFELDLHQINKGEFRKFAVVMFDLNNLKMMNDMYGHGMGDCYIITGSEIIRDIFGELGEIYRIGGDEFCLVSDCITEEIYKKKEKQMCDWLANLQGTQVKEFMQIASGFAKYNRSVDRNLQETLGRADERMYQCKRAQKAERDNGGKV